MPGLVCLALVRWTQPNLPKDVFWLGLLCPQWCEPIPGFINIIELEFAPDHWVSNLAFYGYGVQSYYNINLSTKIQSAL